MEELEQFMGRARRRPLFRADELSVKLDCGRPGIERMLPHRGGFLLLDRIVATDGSARQALGRRRLDPNDPVFADHFPGDPVYPGVLLVEMMGQLALTLPALGDGAPRAEQPPRVRFIRLHDARFIGAALPGDELTVLAELIDDNGYTFLAGGQVMRGAEILAAAVFEALLLEGDEND